MLIKITSFGSSNLSKIELKDLGLSPSMMAPCVIVSDKKLFLLSIIKYNLKYEEVCKSR